MAQKVRLMILDIDLGNGTAGDARTFGLWGDVSSTVL